MDILTQIDQLKAEIDALRPIDEAQERQIMQKFRLEWTYHSNAIEGNSLTFGETKAFLLHGITAAGRPFRDYVEMRGHHQAIDALLAIIRQQEPLTESTIRELHKIILVEPYDMPAQTASGQRVTRRITPGDYKEMDNHVKTSNGETHYYAPFQDVPARMAELLEWYRQADLHPLIVAATFHYRFVEIHPFDDGNGRLARLLMNLILMQSRFPPLVIRTDTKENYLLALEQADADDDLEPFINLIGDSLIKSMELYLRGARGESIEEMGDLERKLALLQKKIRKQELKNERLSEWVTSNFKQHTFSPFFEKLSPQLSMFSQFFKETIISISPDNFLRKAKVNTQHKIEQRWKGFTTNDQYFISLVLEVALEDEGFIISYIIEYGLDDFVLSLDSKNILNGRYGYIPTEQEIETAVKTVTDDIYQLIEQKIASTSGN